MNAVTSDIPNFLTFGTPVHPEEVEIIKRILNKLPKDSCQISIPQDYPELALLDPDYTQINLLSSKDWSKDIKEFLKPVLIDILMLKNAWRDTDQKRKLRHYAKTRKADITTWFDSLVTESDEVFPKEFRKLWAFSQNFKSVQELKKLKEEIRKI